MQLWSALNCLFYCYCYFFFKVCHDGTTEPYNDRHNPNLAIKFTEAQFKCRTFHVPNLIPSIKYLKRLTFEPIKSDSNLGRLIEWPT